MATAIAAINDPAAGSIFGLDALRQSVAAGRTRSQAWRRAQLSALRAMIADNDTEFYRALHDDLGQGMAEALTTQIAFVIAEIDHMLRHLGRWTMRERQPTPWFVRPGHSYIIREPLGLVLVIGSWNLPVAVLLGPAAAAIAAGNAVVMKPSELAPATSALIAALARRYLDRDTIAVVEGGVGETQALLATRFDHIFYTGNGHVGRIVAQAAATNLTPVTLELGGRNPVIVDRTADLRVAARRIAWAKWMNAGQVCVSPDHVLVERVVADAFITQLRHAVTEFYGVDPRASADYGRIVNSRHHDRLIALLAGHGGRLVFGGAHDRASRYIAPTVIADPAPASALMADEIFGPLLPVTGIDDVAAGIATIRARPKPLVVHAFTRDRATADRIEAETSSGAFILNDAVVNHRIPGLPFGGVGESGTGAYHGRAGFETFSHRKAVLRRSTKFDNALRYPPFTERRLWMLRKLIGA